jgi:hypothetical protein
MSKGGIVGFVCLIALAGRSEPAFQQDGQAFRFDTGCLRGALRSQGRSLGIGPVTDTASGVTVAGTLALLGPYRLLDAERRYLPDAREWPSEARLRPDGGVDVRWAADARHPFDLEIAYRWASTNALDAIVAVTAHQPLRRFEVFMASYFQGFPEVYGYAGGGLRKVEKELGDWLAFPRDAEAEAILADGRWQRPPHPVTFKPVARYAGALGVRRDPASGLAALVMAPPAACCAVLMPYGEDGHRSIYHSLFGRDFQAGERAAARMRLVISKNVSDQQITDVYRDFLLGTGSN